MEELIEVEIKITIQATLDHINETGLIADIKYGFTGITGYDVQAVTISKP